MFCAHDHRRHLLLDTGDVIAVQLQGLASSAVVQISAHSGWTTELYGCCASLASTRALLQMFVLAKRPWTGVAISQQDKIGIVIQTHGLREDAMQRRTSQRIRTLCQLQLRSA